VKGLSENIKVISVIDVFGTTAGIYYFRAQRCQKKLYLASADWMPRNFYTRYEIAFPLKDPALRKFLREVVLANQPGGQTKSWILNRMEPTVV